jgi:lipoprotein-anchoring transpeptidase ErfK/SrfK
MYPLLRAFTRSVARLGCLVFIALSFCSCATNQRQEPITQPLAPVLFEWHGDGLTGPTAVHIALTEQKGYIYRGGQPAGWTYLATGTSRHPTPPGVYRVQEKRAQKSSNTYGVIVNAEGSVVNSDAKSGRDPIPPGGRFIGAPMPYWMRLTGRGIGMHAGPIPDPGSPASHGCIRLPQEMAAKLFEVVDIGSPVIIRHTAPIPFDPHAVTQGS